MHALKNLEKQKKLSMKNKNKKKKNNLKALEMYGNNHMPKQEKYKMK